MEAADEGLHLWFPNSIPVDFDSGDPETRALLAVEWVRRQERGDSKKPNKKIKAVH